MKDQLFSLEGKVAVVTGGTSGIGRALSLGLADAGADVIATARRKEQVDDTAKEIEARGRKTLRMASDVGDRARWKRCCGGARALQQSGHPGELRGHDQADAHPRFARGRVDQHPEYEFDGHTAGLPGLRQAHAGARLRAHHQHCVAEQLCGAERSGGLRGEQGGRGIADASLAVEWSKKGVTVNAVAPGVFRTDLNAQLLDSTPRGQELLMRTPMGRFGKTEELVGATVYLASDSASFVTGQILVVDGGFLASGVNQ
jgi:NAD(P)-dependent dehydrogenase (short-subunit alcohol dehydrogenase family)